MDNHFLSIKDFSALSGIKQSTLRYYDDIGFFSPALRGENGYRYYAPYQVVTINAMHLLDQIGVPMKELIALSKNRKPQEILNLLLSMERKLSAQLRELQEAITIENVYRNNIFFGMSVTDFEPAVTFMYPQNIILGPSNKYASDDSFFDAFSDFCKSAETLRINLTLPIGGYSPNIEYYANHPVQPKKFFSLDPSGGTIKPPGTYLVAYRKGNYGTGESIPQKLLRYGEEHQLNFIGPVYAIFLIDELSESDPNNYLQQISVQVAPKS
jgi:DNA-binding transcriptional MerR regulator